ncbi:MAG: ABC transporter substrate-binding protein [Bacteroidetes bacterium]|nr:ABC transporter substrate-binding protein [Bacteroidota bacterium]
MIVIEKHFLFIVVISILFLNSCTSKQYNSEKSVFSYNESAGIISLDPAFSRDQAHIWVCNQLYNSLVKLNDSLNVVPSIAKSWKISEDGLNYTFYLRDDVFFHPDTSFNGVTRKVIASDFVFSFNRLLNPKTASPGAWVLSNVKNTDNNYAIYALNDSTLNIELKQPFPPFMGILSMKYCSVIPHEAVELYGSNFRKHPVGTGPFKLQNWIENIKLVLHRNPNYFEEYNGDQLPYLDGVAVSFLIDKMIAFMEFVKGNFDFISGIDPSYKDELLTRSGMLKSKFTNRFSIIEGPFLNTEYFAFMVDTSLSTVKENPLLNKNVRMAINYGFNRQKMIHYLRNGIGTPGTKGIIPKGMPTFDENAGYGYDYEPEKSKKLIKDAGYNSENPIPEITLVTTPDYLDLCKFVQSQLKDVGIKINIEVSPAATVREMKAHSKLNFFRASWIADYPDEENYLSMFYTKNFTPNGPNYTHLSNPIIDSLYLSSFNITDVNTRIRHYRTIDSLIMEEAPVAVLYYDKVIRFIQKDITGMTINPINMLNLEKVKKVHTD